MSMDTNLPFDKSLFQTNDNSNECNCDGNSNYKECKIMKRLLHSLKFYESLDIIKNKNDAEHFGDFVNNIYKELLNDYIHFNNVHSSELEEINKDLRICNMNSCTYTKRHHRETNEINENKLDSTINFYKDTMDSLHFYLHHCFDVGIRTKTDDNKQTEMEQEMKSNKYFDEAFARTNKRISETRNATKSFDRFSIKKHGKFTIKTDEEEIENKNENQNENDNMTHLDYLYQYLLQHNIEIGNIKKLNEFLMNEEFDTETFEYQMDTCYDNVNFNTNNKCLQQIKKYIKSTKLISFSVGLRFYYWEFYKSLKKLPAATETFVGSINRQNEHAGYDINELFIIGKYASFKEEITNYKHLTLKEYKEATIKVNQYINTKVAKATKGFAVWHYGIAHGDALRFYHLLSLVLYCDFSDLSSDFSSSFRKVKRFEGIKSIKKRNSAYYYFSKYIREVVECYGGCSFYDELRGPFYSGMNILLNIPACVIRLCAPTSTSMQVDVAIKFTGQAHQGIIIKFDNPPTHQCGGLRGFNVSWISKYKEEDERLFVGGGHFMQIQSVTMRATNENFETIIHSLSCLDQIINGGYCDYTKITKNDISVIKNLFNNTLNKMTTMTFDTYIYDTFTAFIQHKTLIALDLFNLDRSTNIEMIDVIMHPLHGSKSDKGEKALKRKDDDLRNLLRRETFLIFDNVKTLIINTSSGSGSVSYSLSMIGLLSLMELGSLDEVILKAMSYHTKLEFNWIHSLWCLEKESLQKQYDEKQYTIDIKEKRKNREYWFVINKKN